MNKKVLVSGCFDLLHSGHIAFFEEASAYGDLYVALGSDQTVFNLKGKLPVNNQDERLYMVRSARSVTDAFVSKGSGMLDFLEEFTELKPVRRQTFLEILTAGDLVWRDTTGRMKNP